MPKQSDLQRAIAHLDIRIAALQEAKAAIEATQTAINKVGRTKKPKVQEGS